MIEVTYIGPHAAVEVETRPHTPGALPVFAEVKRGESVEVTDAIANGDEKAGLGGLLDQPDNWQVTEKKPAAKKGAGD